MATANWGLDRSWKAAIDFSTCGQYRFMKTGSIAGEVTMNTTVGGSVLGVLQNDPKPGEEAVVRHLGFSKVQGNGDASALVWGGQIKSGSDGMAYGYGVGLAASLIAVGFAMEALSSGCQVAVEVLLAPPGYRG